MPLFQLKYARTVILTTNIEADDVEQAYHKAAEMENELKLDLDFGTMEGTLYVKDGVEINDVHDDDSIWDVVEVTQ